LAVVLVALYAVVLVGNRVAESEVKCPPLTFPRFPTPQPWLAVVHCPIGSCPDTRAAMSNRNWLWSKKVFHYLNQGSTLNDTLMRATHGMTDFDLLAYYILYMPMYW